MAAIREPVAEPTAPLAEVDVLTDPRAEAAVLGAVMLDNSELAVVRRLLDPADFWRESHRAIYRAMLAQDGPIDTVTLSGWLRDHGTLKAAGGSAYLVTLSIETPAAVHAEAYAKRLAHLAGARALRATASDVLARLREPEDLVALADSCETELSQALAPMRRQTSAHRGLRRPHDLEIECEAQWDRSQSEVAQRAQVLTGWPDWDREAAIPRGTLTVIGARPSEGKSALALSLQLVLARRGEGVRVFVLEDSAETWWLRAVSQLTGLTVSRVRRLLAGEVAEARAESDLTRASRAEQEWQRVRDAMTELRALPISWDDTPRATVDSLRLQMRQAVREGVRTIVVDHVHEVHPPGWARSQPRHEQVAYAARGLRDLAAELDVAAIALAQIRRVAADEAAAQKATNDQPTGRTPRVEDLAESDVLVQAARLILLVHHPEARFADGENSIGKAHCLQVHVGKSTHGRRGGVINLVCEPARTLVRPATWAERSAIGIALKQRRRLWQVMAGAPTPADAPL